MFVRTTGRPQDEIGRTAWKPKSGTSNLDVVAGKKREQQERWIGFSEDDVHRRRPIISFREPRRKSGGKAASI
jgi:hypothetical protein